MDGLEVKVELNDILDIYENEVSKNTKNKKKIYNFEKNKIVNIMDIIRIIESNNYHINKYNIFTINIPKYRVVMSLGIKDKIINHYVARHILLKKLDKYLDIRNCATRKDMGYDYAIGLVKRNLEKMKKKYNNIYVLKLDLSKYFYSINHDILKSMLIDKLDKEEYSIVSNIIDSTNEEYINNIINNMKRRLLIKDSNRSKEIEKIPIYKKGYGLPIGNMTSQFLSIFYLYKLDHYIVNNLKLKYMIKYMDDYIIFSNDREYLKKCYKIIVDKLKNEYDLDINKKKSMIINVKDGFEYLGYIFKVNNKKTIIKVRTENKKRRNKNIRYNNYMYNNGYINYSKYFNRMSNYINSYKYDKWLYRE